MKAWLSPEGTSADLSNEIGAKSVALSEAAQKGARFLALPVDNTRDTATWILSSFRSSLAVVPLPPALPIPALQARVSQLPKGTVIFPGAVTLSRPPASLPPMKGLEETWAVIFTSGSSGEPKGIALSGSALKASAEAHAAHNGVQKLCWLLDLPLFHVGGLSVLSRAFFLGSEVALGPPRFDPAQAKAWIDSGLVQGLSLVPTTLHRLLDGGNPDFSKLKLVLLGGAPAPLDLVNQALSRGVPLRLTYGMTEHASQIATELQPSGGLVPLPGVEILVSDEGLISVRSPMLASGVYREGRLEPLSLTNGFFATGDLGSFDHGKLQVTGRRSELIISGGMKLFPLEVERELALLPGVVDCAIVSTPDPEWGEIVCALVVENSPGAFDSEAARSSLKAVLEARKVPRQWFLVPRIPRSAAGKILRSELRSFIPTRS